MSVRPLGGALNVRPPLERKHFNESYVEGMEQIVR